MATVTPLTIPRIEREIHFSPQASLQRVIGRSDHYPGDIERVLAAVIVQRFELGPHRQRFLACLEATGRSSSHER